MLCKCICSHCQQYLKQVVRAHQTHAYTCTYWRMLWEHITAPSASWSLWQGAAAWTAQRRLGRAAQGLPTWRSGPPLQHSTDQLKHAVPKYCIEACNPECPPSSACAAVVLISVADLRISGMTLGTAWRSDKASSSLWYCALESEYHLVRSAMTVLERRLTSSTFSLIISCFCTVAAACA